MFNAFRVLFSLIACVVLSVACGDDGEDAPAAKVTCEQACTKTKSCPNDSATNCVMGCSAVAQLCPAQMDALNACVFSTPDDQLFCDVQGETDVVAPRCTAEKDALGACLSQASPQP